MMLLPAEAGTTWTCHRDCVSLPVPHEHWHTRPYKRRTHDCQSPRWEYGDDGSALCGNCGGWARTRPLPERITDERRDDHFSNYTGWDAGYGDQPWKPRP